MHVVEMDQLIAEREDMSIPDIFATYGEEYFRNLETNLLIEMQATKIRLFPVAVARHFASRM